MSGLRLVLFGAPGAGKGTQATFLAETLGIAHFATGNMLRAEVDKKSPLGQKVEAILQAGQLVDDALVMALVQQNIEENRTRGFILDGFPRTVAQAQLLDALLKTIHQPIDAVVELVVDEEALVTRLSGRITYLYQRPDDKAEVVRQRFSAYRAQTEAVRPYYQQQGIFKTIDGMQPVASVREAVRATLPALMDA
jgi:adenylate kinase